MDARELALALQKGDISDFLHHSIAIKTDDGTLAAGREAVAAILREHHLLDGFVPASETFQATVAGTNGAGLALKVSLFDGMIGKIIVKRPDPRKRRIRMVVAYDGTAFFGFQRQAALRSVQAELEAAIAPVNDAPTTVNGASRTDTGVHAYAQVVHFDSVREFDAERWRMILNHALPADLHVVSAAVTHPLFHSRFDVFAKEYRYVIDTGEFSPLRRNSCWFTGPLDLTVLKREMKKVEGTHDFTSFCRGDKDSKIRTIFEARVESDGSTITLVFCGHGFLHNMIRLLVASLVAMAQGRLDSDIEELLAAKNRERTQDLAPAGGLYLVRIDY